MKVQINGFPIEIELEKEKNISEVVESLTTWTAERNLIFVGIEVDDNYFDLEEIPEISIEATEVLNCVVQSKSDIVYDTVNEAIEYCERVVHFSSQDDHAPGKEELDDLILGIEWLHEVFKSVSALLSLELSEMRYRDKSVDFYMDKLNSLKQSLADYIASSDEAAVFKVDEDLFDELIEILAIFLVSEEMKKLVVDSIDSPDVLISSLKGIHESLPDHLKSLEEAAIAYQTGKDKEGVEKLFKFIDFMFGYTRTSYQIAPVFNLDYDKIEIDGINLNEKNRDLNNLLNDTMEVIENNDMISLADILEYEMTEAIENLEGYIVKIMDEISN